MRSSFAFNKPERAESYVDSQFLSSPTAQTGEASPSFYRDASDLGPPVKLISATKIYPWGKEDSAKPMVFPDASAKPANMIWPDDASAFEMLLRFVDSEPDWGIPDADWRGMLAAIGIVKGKPFNPDDRTRGILDKAAMTAWKTSKMIAYENTPDLGEIPYLS
jgi:hypothetical protein